MAEQRWQSNIASLQEVCIACRHSILAACFSRQPVSSFSSMALEVGPVFTSCTSFTAATFEAWRQSLSICHPQELSDARRCGEESASLTSGDVRAANCGEARSSDKAASFQGTRNSGFNSQLFPSRLSPGTLGHRACLLWTGIVSGDNATQTLPLICQYIDTKTKHYQVSCTTWKM